MHNGQCKETRDLSQEKACPATLLAFLGLLALSGLPWTLTGCGADGPPRLSDSGPPASASPAQWKWNPAARGALLVATGRQSFAGRTAARCALHEQHGIQINLRTGDPSLPAVAVRIAEYRGSGSYRAEVFVTGRNRAGALAGSTGEATLDLQEQPSRAQLSPEAAILLGGWFEGSYEGAAGRGSVQGRFGGCLVPLPRATAPPPAEPRQALPAAP